MTHGLHGFAAVAAVAATLYWRQLEPGPAATLAGALSLRLTFFGLPAVLSELPARNLACSTVPRLRAERGEGSFKELRAACTQRYRDLEPFVRIAAEERDGARSLLAHLGLALSCLAGELATQLTAPDCQLELASLYPYWPTPGMRFLAVAFLGVMLPAATSHLGEGRLRFPLDLMFLPVVVALGWRAPRGLEPGDTESSEPPPRAVS